MVYLISDVHGYSFDKILGLLRQAEFGEDDFLYVLGDVIDRGADGVKMLQWMLLQPNVELILGNHEAMLLSCDFIFDEVNDAFLDKLDQEKLSLLQTWQFNGAEPTLKALAALPKPARTDLLAYLRDAPLFDAVSVRGRDYLLTHSGLGHFDAGKKMSDYAADDLLWNRPDPDTRYFDDITVVFGHTPTVMYGQRYAGRIMKTETWINIDTGSGFGYAPALLCLDNMKEYYID